MELTIPIYGHFATLAVNLGGKQGGIKANCQALVKKWHSDHNLNNRAEAEEWMKRINKTNSILSDVKTCNEYDFIE